MRRNRQALLLIVVLFASAWITRVSSAMTLTVSSYSKSMRGENRSFAILWLDGLYNGIMIADIVHNVRNGESLFCPPAKLVITGEVVVNILDNYLSEHSESPDAAIPIVLIKALQEVFPCK